MFLCVSVEGKEGESENQNIFTKKIAIFFKFLNLGQNIPILCPKVFTDEHTTLRQNDISKPIPLFSLFYPFK